MEGTRIWEIWDRSLSSQEGKIRKNKKRDLGAKTVKEDIENQGIGIESEITTVRDLQVGIRTEAQKREKIILQKAVTIGGQIPEEKT